MYAKVYKIKIDTYLPLTQEQEQDMCHLIAMKLKELEYSGPNGNIIQRAMIIENK